MLTNFKAVGQTQAGLQILKFEELNAVRITVVSCPTFIGLGEELFTAQHFGGSDSSPPVH